MISEAPPVEAIGRTVAFGCICSKKGEFVLNALHSSDEDPGLILEITQHAPAHLR